MMPKIFTYANQDVLAGLVWAPGKQAGFLRRAPLALTWADRMALLPEAAEYRGRPSLLACLTGGLGDETHKARVLVAYAPLSGLQASPAEAVDVARGLFFAAVLVNGKPALGAEHLFDTRAELLGHIDVECSSGQIDRLATTPGLAKEIHSPIPVSLIAEPTVATSRTVPSGTPAAPTRPRAPIIVEGKTASRLPVWQLAVGGGVLTLALAAGALFLFSGQQSKPVATSPIAAVQITTRDGPAFGRNCLAAFAGVWPLAPGWQLVSEGCATPEMRDPALEGFADLAGLAGLADFAGPADHPVAYRIYHLRRGFDPAIARKAAEAVASGAARATGATSATSATGAFTAAPAIRAAGATSATGAIRAAPASGATSAITAARAFRAARAITVEIRGNRMFSSTQIAAPMRVLATNTNTGASLTPAALLAATEAVFLGLADSIVLDSGSGSRGHAPKVRVTLKSGFAEVFERTARLKGAEIARLNRSGKTVTLDIIPRRIVTARTRAAVPLPITEASTASRIAPEPDRTPDMQEGGTL